MARPESVFPDASNVILHLVRLRQKEYQTKMVATDHLLCTRAQRVGLTAVDKTQKRLPVGLSHGRDLVVD